MVRTLALAAAFLLASPPAAVAPASSGAFDRDFAADRTMRVDVVHTGDAATEIVTLHAVVNDGAWPGSRTRLIDETNLGAYQFVVLDQETSRPLFSRGYSSVYGEYETTDEAKHTKRSFSESLRFPWPKRPVQVVLKRRDRQNLWKEIWSTAIDPASPAVNSARLAPRGTVWTVLENGPAAEKVDLLVLGEGYTEKELPKFHADVKRLVEVLFRQEPFKGRRKDFNVRALDLPSAETGISRPQSGIFRRTPLSAQYGIFGSERYVLTYDDRALRDAASAAPYDFLEILVNDARYGGGGIYAHQATASVDTGFADYVFVHEFGHHFAGLADEYYTSDVAYETGVADKPEPWEPNVTALKDPKKPKWADLVTPGTPLPTPWEKEAFEADSKKVQAERRKRIAAGASPAEIDSLFREQLVRDTKLLGGMTHSGKVGAFEGAAYEAKGLYRSSADCIMFTRDEVGFCPVCRRAIERVIDEYARP